MKDTMIPLSLAQIEAALIACSNYTPPRGESWAQRSQSIAVQRLRVGRANARAVLRAAKRKRRHYSVPIKGGLK